jgi:rhodanese-related sulfurtransferase
MSHAPVLTAATDPAGARPALASIDLDALPSALAAAQAAARREGLDFAGHVDPATAWSVVQAGQALLVDVRSAEELAFVGRVPAAAHAAWASGIALQRNPGFLDDLARVGGFARPVLLLCRSGVRSVRAAQAATAAGHPAAFNVLEGFEGALDTRAQRGAVDGWRRRGLPWVQG